MMKADEVPESTTGHSDASVIEQFRDLFESELNSGNRSSIEQWLLRVPQPLKEQLFGQLLEIEIRFHHQHGTDLNPDEYCRRFPEFDQQVHVIFQKLTGESGQSSDSISLAMTVVAPKQTKRQQRTWNPGSVVGRYRLDKFIGRGSFGEVWKGFDPELKRVVAIKVPRHDSTDDPESSRFRDEARRAATLNHQGIVPVYDVGPVGDAFFIVSEFVDGPTLAAQMKKEKIPRARAVHIAHELALILHKAHQAGIIHRDIKPSNILIRKDGTPAITDFGLAISEEEQLNLDPGIAGTLAYMSPEQARGQTRSMDGRSDLYSLGVVLFQLLTGRLPFQYRTSDELLEQIRTREVRPLRSIDDTISQQLDETCLKCLAKDVRDRYATGLDLANALRGCERSERRPGRAVGIAVAVAVILCVVGASTYGWWGKPSKKAENVPPPGKQAVAGTEWLPMLDQPLDRIVWLKGQTTDFVQHDEQNEALTVRSEQNYLILASRHSGSSTVRIRGTIFLDNWIGTVGFVWGLGQDPNTFPKKPPRGYACLLERMDEAFPLSVTLREIQTAECFPEILCVDQLTGLGSQDIDIPATSPTALEIVFDDSGLKVFIDGKLQWDRTADTIAGMKNILNTSGQIGIIVRGKTVILRDAAVRF